MPTEAATLGFRPMGLADLPLFRDWVARPHWQAWWGAPDDEVGLVAEMIVGRDSTRPFLIEGDGVALGYIQVWRLGDQLVEPWLTEAPWLRWFPPEAVGVDLSIGDPARLGQGLGSRALAAFVARLRGAGHRTILIDPDRRNARAIRCYEKAGFRPIPDLPGDTSPTLLMRHEPQGDSP